MTIPDPRRSMLARIFGRAADPDRREPAARQAASADRFGSDARTATLPPMSLGGRTAREPSLTRYERPKLLGDAPVAGNTQAKGDAAFSPEVDAIRRRDVRISIHNGLLSQFEVVHRLVNSADRLNFTKSRLPSDPADARLTISKLLATPDYHAAYVKASDKHRSYGVVGCFIMHGEVLQHFLFSSDVLGLGIEQAVYQLLGYPGIVVVGSVDTNLKKARAVDWVLVVDDAERSRPDQAEAQVAQAQASDPPAAARGNLLPSPHLLAGDGWATLGDAQAHADPKEAPAFAGSCVLAHALPPRSNGGEGLVYGCYLKSGLAPGEVYTLSASVWIPPDFHGSRVAVLFVGYRSEAQVAASVSNRGQWQRIQASARIPTGASNAFPALSVVGDPGGKVYSAGWTVEQAATPSAYLGQSAATATAGAPKAAMAAS